LTMGIERNTEIGAESIFRVAVFCPGVVMRSFS
jgi:hypothetical protein